jgi:hypothetical protein
MVNGEILGSPGAVGALPICILFGAGVPSAQVLDPTQANLQSSQLGSLYIDFSTPGLWFKTSQPMGWTQIAIP